MNGEARHIEVMALYDDDGIQIQRKTIIDANQILWFVTMASPVKTKDAQGNQSLVTVQSLWCRFGQFFMVIDSYEELKQKLGVRE